MQQSLRSAAEFAEKWKCLPFKVNLSKYLTGHQQYRAKQLLGSAAVSTFQCQEKTCPARIRIENGRVYYVEEIHVVWKP